MQNANQHKQQNYIIIAIRASQWMEGREREGERENEDKWEEVVHVSKFISCVFSVHRSVATNDGIDRIYNACICHAHLHNTTNSFIFHSNLVRMNSPFGPLAPSMRIRFDFWTKIEHFFQSLSALQRKKSEKCVTGNLMIQHRLGQMCIRLPLLTLKPTT